MSVKPIGQVAPVKSTPELDRPVAASVSAIKAGDFYSQKKAEKTSDDAEVRVSREDADNFAEVMNEVAKMTNSQLNFEVFEDTKQLYVQVVDAKTREVIKQIPSKEMLELSAKIKEMVGLILDKYA